MRDARTVKRGSIEVTLALLDGRGARDRPSFREWRRRVPASERPNRPRSANAGARRRVGDSAGVDRRVDLRGRQRPPAGDRPRRATPQAVSSITQCGSPSAIRTSSTRSNPSPRCCRGSAGRSVAISPCRSCEGARARGRRPADGPVADPVGGERYRRENGSFGLTTLRNRHVRANGAAIALDFRGKAGVRHQIRIEDERVARVVRDCLDLPGQVLFQYQGTPA